MKPVYIPIVSKYICFISLLILGITSRHANNNIYIACFLTKLSLSYSHIHYCLAAEENT